jgi:biotin carboxyl carrier protein
MAKIAINSTGFNVTKQDDKFLLNDQPVHFDLITLPNNSYHLILDNQSYTIEVLEKHTSSGDLRIKINGRVVETQLQNKLAELLKSMGMESGKKKLKELKAPMPGLVLDVKVTAGDAITEGQDLLVLEAMKMENAIKSPQDGIIESVAVAKNDKIDKNQILVTFQ